MGEAARRWSLFVAGAVMVGAISVLPAAANAAGAAGESAPASCDVYPIGVRSSVLASARAGDPIADLTLGAPTGHEGWLTWDGAVDEPTLGRSLTPPGDSERYVNPDDPTDHVVSAGDWVTGRPGSVSSSGVRKSLDKLIGKPIVVPTWVATRPVGRNVAYRVAGFATVQFTSYRLPNDNRIGAIYLGPSSCATPQEGPVAQATSAATSEDHPVTITLTGTNERSAADLTYRLTSPSHGTTTLGGDPVCQRDAADRVSCTLTVTYTPVADHVGADELRFTVSDGASDSLPAKVAIAVSEINDPPVAGADSAAAGSEPLSLDVATLVANDTAGPANEADQELKVTAASAGQDAHGSVELAAGAVTYVAEAGFAGTATFTYTVCDDGTTAGTPDPQCADGVVTVTVAPAPNEPPVAAPATVDGVEDTPVAITLTGSDPDDDPVSFAVVAAPAHGTLSGSAPDLTYTPAADYFGPDEFRFTVSDGNATSLPAVVAISLSEVNDPPVAGADSVTAAAARTLVIDVADLLANDVAGPPNEAGQLLTLDAVDEGADTHGTLSLGDEAITYVPEPGFSGAASFTYTVCDDGTTAGEADPQCTAAGRVTINIGAPNQPPVADPDAIVAVEDTAIPVTLTGSDPDGDPLTFAMSAPGNGTLSGTAPDLVYTPRANFFGEDTFTFTAFDGQANSVPATVSVTVSEVNDPALAGADSMPVPGHQPTAVSSASLLANDTPGPSNEATQTLAVTDADGGPDAHGTVALARGTITYVPDPAYVGPASFTYTACDNGTTAGQPDPLCVDGVVSLAVSPAPNAAPSGEPAVVDGIEDTALPVTLVGDDADGDPLTFAVASAPSHGTLSGTAPDLVYTPAPDYFGPDQLRFTVFDGQSTSVPVTVSITVSEVNDPPSAGADAVTATGGQPLTMDPSALLANDIAGPPNETGQVLDVTAVVGGADTHGTVSLADGTITYAPDIGFAGSASFTYTVCDNGTTDTAVDPRCTSTGTVTVAVVAPDQPPVAVAQSLTVAEDHQLPITLSASDPDGDPLTFAIAATPAHGTLSGTAPALIYTPAADYFGSDSFTFTANDGASNSSPATVSVTVTEVNDPPVLGTDSVTLGGGGTLPPPPPVPSCGAPCGVIFGDPHMLTFDGAGYDAQAVGEVIAAKSTTDDFEVQARFAPVLGDRRVSIATGVAARVNGTRVAMYRTATGMDTRINGTLVTPSAFPQPLPTGGTIGTYGLPDTVIVVWPDGSLAIVRAVGVFPEYFRFTVSVGLAPTRLGNMTGLLGDADGGIGNHVDDLVTRGGQPVTFPNTPFAEMYGTYINSWRISNAESLLDYGAGQSTETFTDLTYPDAPATLTTLQRTRGTATCNLFGLAPALLDACILDVGLTGDADFATTAADAQEDGLGIPTNAGSVDVGTETTVVTTTAGENAVRTFPATSGQKMALRIIGNTFTQADVTIRNPSGGTVGSLFADAPTEFLDTFTLSVTGTYTITVDPRVNQTGTLTFQLIAVPGNTGSTVVGTPTTVVTTTIGEDAERTFAGTAGQKLTFSVSGNTFGGGVELWVRRPGSTSSAASLVVFGASGFRDTFTLADTGTYTFVVDPRDQQTGSVTFLLSPVASNSGSTVVGTPTTVVTTTIGEDAERTFAGTAGQKLTFSVSGNTFGGGVELWVRRPGSTSSAASLVVFGASGFRDTFTLADTGTYTFVIDPRDQQTGSVTFLLSPVASNSGSTVVGTPTTVVTTTIGEDAERTFAGTAGQKLTFSVSGNTFGGGVELWVRRPGSTSSAASLVVFGASGFRDTFTLADTGTYTFVVNPYDQQTGSVTFLLSPVASNSGSTVVGTPTTVVTTTIGEDAERTFAGTAGQKLTFSVSGNTFGGGVELWVRRPGSTSSAASLVVFGATGFRDTFTLADTGTYTFMINPYDQQTGSVTFLLSPVAVNSGSTVVGTPTTVVTTTIGEDAERTFAGTAGQKLTFSVSGNTFGGGVELWVRRPGSTSSAASLVVFGATGFRDTFTLPDTGTYTFMINPYDQQTGSVTFLLAEAPAAGGGALAATDDPAPTTREAPLTDESVELAAEPVALAAAIAPLTLTVAELLANDRPGPDNESTQALTVTAVTPGPFTHGDVSFADGVVTYLPDEDFVGNATISYTACDDGTTNGVADPRCATGSISVKVTVNHPPVVNPQAVTTAEDTPVGLTLTGTDPDGESIAFVAAAPGRGTLAGTPPSFTYTPAPDANGVDTFTFTANDGKDQSAPATVTVTVTPINDPPVPRSDSRTARAGEPVIVPVATLVANDEAGPFDERTQALTVITVTAGAEAHGTATLAAGNLTFVPEAGFVGTALIGYTVCDDGATNGAADPRCADSTVSITANRSPVANDQSAQTSLTAPVAVQVSATDPDGDALTFAIAAEPAHGVLTGTLPNITYRAVAGFVGSDSFTFTAADAHGASAPATVSITVSDVPSPALGPDSTTARAGQTVLVDVLANDTPGSGTIDATTLAITAAPTKGTAVVLTTGRVRYAASAGTSGADAFSYTVCDDGGGCATAVVSVEITENTAPVAVDDTYDTVTGTTLRPEVPGVLVNDSDANAGDALHVRLVTGVTNGRLLLSSTGTFTYVPNGPGIDTFTYRVVDSAGAVSNDGTVTIYVTGPAGPPIVGNDLYEVQQGRELAVAVPGVLVNDYGPNPRLDLTVLLQRDAAKGTLLLQSDGSFVYTPLPGFTGIDQFSYRLRDAEGRLSPEARVGITVTAGGPPTATIGATSPVAGATILGPTHVTGTLVAPPGETVTEWTVSYRRPGSSTIVPLAAGAGPVVAADFDATQLRNGAYSIVIRAVTSGGGVLVSETGVSVEGEYKPGRYSTTFSDMAINSSNIPIELFRTYDSTNKAAGDFGAGWSLDLANFRVESNGPLGGGGWSRFTCGSFPFLATCYESSQPHFVTVTWPDGRVERFRFAPDRGSQLVPSLTTAGFVAEPGTTSTLEPVGGGLLLSGSDFLLGDFFSADGIYDPIQFVLTDKSGTRYRIDRRAGLLGITDRNGNTVSLGSDGVASSSGLSMTFVRDAQDRITSVVGPQGSVEYTYDAAGDLVGVRYPDGTTQTFTYDGEHNLLTVSGGGRLVRTVHYDEAGRVRAITDGNGATATISSDVAGHQQVTTDATGRLTTVLTLDDRGKVISRDDTFEGRTVTTSATFDAFGRQRSATDGNGNTSFTTYDGDGNVLTKTDGNGHTTRYTYNDFGLVLTVTDPTSRVTTYTYDDRGNVLTEEAPGGATVTYDYDARGLLISKTDAAGTTTYTNDDAGHPASATDPEGNKVSQVVDAATGWVTSRTDGEQATTTYEYDDSGMITHILDDHGDRRSFVYDEFGRVTTFTDSTERSFTRTYDGNGNIVAVDDRNGTQATYDYDEVNRLVEKSVPGTGTATYTYDPLGRVVTATNSTATLSFTYDDAGNVLTASSTLPAATFTYTYDDGNRRISASGPGGTTTYAYDDADRVTSVTDPAGGAFDMTYTPRGLLETLERPNGVDDTWTYDETGEITAIESRLGAAVVGEISYAYDGAGQRTSMTSSAGTTAFEYDDNLQLTAADHPVASGLTDESYDYDALGNRTAATGVPAGSFEYDAGNRLLSDAGTDYAYDDEGNVLSRTVRSTGAITSYTWSAEHELLGIGYPDGSTTSFRYDPFGRRVESTDAGTITRYAFDRDAIAAIYDGAGALVATFTRDGTDPTRTLEMTRGSARHFILVDGLGSTVALTDISGNVVGSYAYDAFGNTTHSGAVASPFTFTGQLAHDPSGLLLFPARAYDPTLGRFLSEDPVFALNLYHYGANDPVNVVDPTGRNTVEYHSQGGDAAWKDLVRRALVEGEANSVRWIRPRVPTTRYGLGSKLRQAAWELSSPQHWL